MSSRFPAPPVPVVVAQLSCDHAGQYPAKDLLLPMVRGRQVNESAALDYLKSAVPPLTSGGDFDIDALRVSKSTFIGLAEAVRALAPAAPPQAPAPVGVARAQRALSLRLQQAIAGLGSGRDFDGGAPAELAPFLLLGAYHHAKSEEEVLRRLGVTHVLNCAVGVCKPPYRLYRELGIQLHAFDAQDDNGYPLLLCHMKEAFDFINSALASTKCARVLVHCFAGINRSAAMALAYMFVNHPPPMQGQQDEDGQGVGQQEKEGDGGQQQAEWMMESLVRDACEKRPIILSNSTFVDQLALLAVDKNTLLEEAGVTAHPQIGSSDLLTLKE